MFQVIVTGALAEPYNLNDRENMIMLPTQESEAEEMGLPRHLEGSGVGARNHPKYSAAVYTQTLGEVVPLYEGLASALKDRKHKADDSVPAIKGILEGISEATYNAIIAVAGEERIAGALDVTLDSIASKLYS